MVNNTRDNQIEDAFLVGHVQFIGQNVTQVEF